MVACAPPAVLCVLEVARTWEAKSLLQNSRVAQVRLCDRTALILDIFGQRAATREGQLQVKRPLFLHCGSIASWQFHTPRWPHAVQLSAVLWLF